MWNLSSFRKMQTIKIWKFESTLIENFKIIFPNFQFPNSKTGWSCSRALYLNFERMVLHSNQYAFGIVGSRSVPITWEQFLTRSDDAIPPSHQPPRKPNKNENRNHSNTLGPLRSPPPAANWHRASSTALCAACSYCYDYLSDVFFTVSCIACMNVKSGLLRSGS